MKNPRSRRLILGFLCICITALLPALSVLSCYAENYPDISEIDPNLYYKYDRQFYHRPDGGYVLVSTNKTNRTLAALLDDSGNLDYSCARDAIPIKFYYQAACPSGNFLYLTGMDPDIPNCVEIGRLDLSSGTCVYNKVIDVTCDFTRDFRAEEDGRIRLVTAPAGENIDPSLPASLLIFEPKENNAIIYPQKPSPPSSSEIPVSSDPSSSEPSSSKPESSQPEEDFPDSIGNYRFSGPVTVEELQKELDANAPGKKLRVLTKDKNEVKSGKIGTGFLIQTLSGGKTETIYTAVIPGDLDGSGAVTENDCRILYEYLTHSSASSAVPLLHGPYLEAAKINEENQVDTTGRDLHTSDLLEIKKLIK